MARQLRIEFGIKGSAVSGIIRTLEEVLNQEQKFKKKVEYLKGMSHK